jgi:putative acetyltransferase
MRVRPYAPGDAEAMAALYQRSVRALGPSDYAPKQVEAWAGAGPSALRFAERMEDGRWAFVADRADGELLGFIDLEADGHIDFLYVAPEAKGRGVADRLLDAVEQVARSAEVQRLYSEASEAARRFFVRRGFVVLRRRDFEVGGVPIHNYAVEKRL